MKKEGALLVFIVLIASLALVSSYQINVTNVSLKQNYSLGETLSGEFFLRLRDINPEYDLKTNLGHSISLKDFLKNNSKALDCESFNCVDRYATNSSGYNSGVLRREVTYGFKLIGSERIDSISNIKFNLTLNFPEQNQIPVSLQFFEYATPWTYQEPSENYTRYTSYGCFNPLSSSEPSVVLGEDQICERIVDMPSTKRALLGINYTLNLGDQGTPTVYMSLHKIGNSAYDSECNFTAVTDNSCIVNYEEAIPSGDYYVCARKGQHGDLIKLYTQQNAVSCGSTPRGSASSLDYSVLIRLPTYRAESNKVVEIDLENLESGQNILGGASNYLNKYYQKNCSSGCVLPLFMSGIANQVIISNIGFNYMMGNNEMQENKIYNITKIQTTANFEGIVNLEKAGFLVDFVEEKNLSVYLSKGGTRIQLFNGSVRVSSGTMVIKYISPINLPAGVPTIISADVFSATPISSYQWVFGDGTTSTTNTNSVIKTYNNISTFGLTLKVTDNSGNMISKNFTINSITPRNYLNKTIEQKSEDLDSFRGDVELLSIPLKDKIKQRLNLDGIQTSIDSISSQMRTSTTDQQFLDLAISLGEIDVPQKIWVEESITDSFITNPSDIDLTVLSAIAKKKLTDTKYKELISSWEISNVIGTKEKIVVALVDSKGVKKTFAIVYDISVKTEESETNLIIQGASGFESTTSFQEAGTAKTVSLNAGEEKKIQIISFESNPAIIYVSPDPKSIDVVKGISPCNNNMVCEKSLGEDYKNCRSDCRPWPRIIWMLIVVTILAIIAYTFVQIQFKKNYERHLFKSDRELQNLIESIRNSQENKVPEKEIIDKLIKTGWSREQVMYALKKSRGEKTRPYELIPIDRIINSFNKKQNKSEKK